MKLIFNVSWVFVANVLVSVSKWVILVIIAKIFNPEIVGVYSLALAISAPITLFANMKLRSLYLTEEKYEFSDYLFTRNILSLIAIIIIFIVSIIFYSEYVLIIILVSIMKILDLQSEMYYAIPHKANNLSYVGKLMIWKHVITLLAFLIIIFLFESLPIALLAYILFQLLFLYLIEIRGIRNKYSIVLKTNFNHIGKVIKLGAPLGFVQLVVSINTSYPRYVLEAKESAEVLGYFSAIAYIVVVGNMMMNAIAQAFIPFLSNKLKKKEFTSFSRIVNIHLFFLSLFLGLIVMTGCFLFGDVFLGLVYGSEYAKYTDILLLMSLALSISFLNWNYDIALLAMRYLTIQPKISLVILIINLILGFILIEYYGIYGATYSIIVINLIQLGLRALFVNLKLGKYIKLDRSTST